MTPQVDIEPADLDNGADAADFVALDRHGWRIVARSLHDASRRSTHSFAGASGARAASSPARSPGRLPHLRKLLINLPPDGSAQRNARNARRFEQLQITETE